LAASLEGGFASKVKVVRKIFQIAVGSADGEVATTRHPGQATRAVTKIVRQVCECLAIAT
jgi:hypothetical protein